MDHAGKVNKGAHKRARSLTTASSQNNNAKQLSEGEKEKRAKHDGSTQKPNSAYLNKNSSKSRSNRKESPSHLRHANAAKHKQPRSIQQHGKGGNKFIGDGERYAVIITNVENDFSKVHEELLQFHCHLDPTHKQSEFTSQSLSLFTKHDELMEKKKQEETLQQGESDLSNLTETKVDAISDMNKKAECTDSKAAVAQERNNICVYQLKCRNETRSAELTVYGNSPESISSIFVAPSTNAQRSNPNAQHFTSLKKMISKVAHKPYFDHMVKFYLNSANSAVQLPSVDGDNDNNVNSRRNHIDDGQTAAETATKKTSKTVEDDDSVSCQNNDESKDVNNLQNAQTGAETSQMEQERKTQKEKQRLRQRELVTAIAEISVPLSNNELRTRFAVLPHFVSSWQIRSRTFRVVFANEQSLFDAKQLLDQFELDGNVRVLLRLSDDLQQRFTSFLASLDTHRE